MMKKFLMVLTVMVVFSFGFIGISSADPVTFFGEDLGLGESTPLSSWPNAAAAESAFLANLQGVGTEDFESFEDGTPAPLSLTFPGAGTATLRGDGEINVVPSGQTNGVGRYAISGTHYWETGASFNFVIEFSEPIAAFGFYAVDAGDFNGQLQLIASNGTTHVLNIPHTIGAPGGSVFYFGFYDLENTYTKIQFGNTGSEADWFGFDNMTIGSLQQVNPVVPVPSTLLLLGSGLLGMVGCGRKRFSKKS